MEKTKETKEGDAKTEQLDKGEIIVEELLEECLKDVYSETEWDITKRARLLEIGGRRELTKGEQWWNFELIITDHAPSRILTHYTLRPRPHVSVLQLKVVEQKASGYCGYYALHYALCLLEACHSSSEGAVLGLLEETASVGGVWRRYWYSVSQLLVRGRSEEAWPWTEEYITRGDLERSFLQYLFDVDPHLNFDMEVKNKLIVLQFSFGLLQDNFETICETQDKITSFVNNTSSPAHLIFILGVTNHWLTLLAYKRKEACPCHHGNEGCGSVHMLYMDSNNTPAISLCDEGIEDYVKEQEKKKKAVKGYGYQKWKRNVIKQAYIDQRTIVNRISRYISGEADMIEEVISEYVDKLLISFNTHIEKSLISADPDFYIPLLLSWLEGQYPVKVLRDNLLPFISNSTISHLMRRDENIKEDSVPLPLSPLKDWASLNHSRLAGLSSNSFGIDQVDSFASLLSTILDKL